jgi:hypothetical protein
MPPNRRAPIDPADKLAAMPGVTEEMQRRFGKLFSAAKFYGWSFPELRAAAAQAYGKPLIQFSDEEIETFLKMIEARGRRKEEQER